MKLNNVLVVLMLSAALMACGTKKSEQDESSSSAVDSTETAAQTTTKVDLFIQSIEEAHQKAKIKQKEVIQFDLNLSFGGKTKFNGSIVMTPSGNLIKMKDSARTLIWDGNDVLISPDSANTEGARFSVLTWSYFFAAAYKLSDPGAQMKLLGEKSLKNLAVENADSTGFNYDAARLYFGDEVGDSPDDWYIVYKDKETNLLAAMAYIVTFGGKSKEKAEETPHLITYEAYADVEGIPIATQWNFWTWNQEGEMGKLLGEARLTNIKFIKQTTDLFKTAGNTKRVEKPEV